MANLGSAFYESSQKDYLNSLLKFIPVTVVHHLADHKKSERATLPQCQMFTSAVLVAEVCNFYDQEKLLFQTENINTSTAESRYNENLSILSGSFLD